MTPEEMAALEQYILQQQAQTNPLAYAANDWGQGPGFMGLDEQPESWDRVGEVNDLLYDMTRTTGIDFAEMVPGLNPFVAPPKQTTPYQSDTSFLYSSNPVYQSINELVSGADGGTPMSLDQALARVQAEYKDNPEAFQGMLPVAMEDNFNAGVRAGDPDWSQVRSGATTFLTEGRKEQNSMSEAEALQQQYEDFVRPRSQWEAAGSPEWSQARSQLAQELKWDDPRMEFQELNPGTVQAKADRVPMDLSGVRGGGRVIPGMELSDIAPGYSTNNPEIQLAPDRITSLTRNPLAGARRQQRGDQARADAEAVRNSPNRPMVGYIQGRGENLGVGRNVVVRDMNENAAKRGFEMALKEAKNKQVASKKEENIAKLIAAYNSYHYGQA